MPNFLDAEIEALRLVYEESKKWGIELNTSHFPLSTRLLMRMGSKSGRVSNEQINGNRRCTSTG